MKNACVVLNYNDSETTKQLVETIKEYAIIDYIVVVDNCSTDDSFNILKKLVSEKVHVIQTDKNGGYGYGNNRGFEYAYNLGAEYVAILNPDVEFTEECFSTLVAALQEEPNCGAIAPISLDSNQNISKIIAWKQPSIIMETLMSSVILNRLFRRWTHYNNDYIFTEKRVCDVDIIPGSFLLLNGNNFRSVGMYDENVFLYCEEKILGWKYAEKGIKTKLVTDINYIHRHSVTIDKNIKSHIRKTGIWLDSKRYFIKNYMLKSKKMIILINIIFTYAKFESLLVGSVKKYVKKRK